MATAGATAAAVPPVSVVEADLDGQLARLVGENSGAPPNQAGPPCAAATEAERRALLLRHCEDWRVARLLVEEAATTADLTVAKTAKTLAEALRVIQSGERAAWGLDALAVDLDALSDEDLERLADGHMPRR